VTTWFAAALAGLAAAALVPPRSSLQPPRPLPPLALLVPAAALVALAWSRLPTTTFALGGVLGLTGLGVASAVRRRRAAAAADRASEEVLAACEALASDLAAGQPPLTTLERLAEEWPALAPAAVAGRMGADVPTAFRALAERPGCGQLRVLSASWAVAHRTGSGLARSVDRAAESIRSQRRTARLVAGELAAARATARLLAVLPLGVLLLGTGIGGDPVGFLLGTPIGIGCLGAGLALSLAGMRWLEAIADRVLRP
jgi:tight adherence protein B